MEYIASDEAATLTMLSIASENTAAEPPRKYATNFTHSSDTPTTSDSMTARDSSAGTWRNRLRIVGRDCRRGGSRPVNRDGRTYPSGKLCRRGGRIVPLTGRAAGARGAAGGGV